MSDGTRRPRPGIPCRPQLKPNPTPKSNIFQHSPGAALIIQQLIHKQQLKQQQQQQPNSTVLCPAQAQRSNSNSKEIPRSSGTNSSVSPGIKSEFNNISQNSSSGSGSLSLEKLENCPSTPPSSDSFPIKQELDKLESEGIYPLPTPQLPQDQKLNLSLNIPVLTYPQKSQKSAMNQAPKSEMFQNQISQTSADLKPPILPSKASELQDSKPPSQSLKLKNSNSPAKSSKTTIKTEVSASPESRDVKSDIPPPMKSLKLEEPIKFEINPSSALALALESLDPAVSTINKPSARKRPISPAKSSRSPSLKRQASASPEKSEIVHPTSEESAKTLETTPTKKEQKNQLIPLKLWCFKCPFKTFEQTELDLHSTRHLDMAKELEEKFEEEKGREVWCNSKLICEDCYYESKNATEHSAHGLSHYYLDSDDDELRDDSPANPEIVAEYKEYMLEIEQRKIQSAVVLLPKLEILDLESDSE